MISYQRFSHFYEIFAIFGILYLTSFLSLQILKHVKARQVIFH